MNSVNKNSGAPKILMLLSNGFDPHPRVYNEARSLVEHGYVVRILAGDRDRLPAEINGYELTSPNARFSAPNKLFEALAAGRPLFTAKFGEIGRIAAEYGCGFILKDYSVAEILRGLDYCTDVDLLKEMKVVAARAGKRECNWDRAEQILLSGYEELIPRAPQYNAHRTSEAVAR